MAPDRPATPPGIGFDESDDPSRGAGDEDEESRAWVVRFALGDERFAVPVESVRTVTDAPDELTRIPRSPAAVEGLTDLRGEITAVIDPRVHFPSVSDGDGSPRLLVFDRPSDEQSAAVRIDDVVGVESVPDARVLEADDLEDRELSGDALAHPLVVALVEHERDRDADGGVGSNVTVPSGSDAARASAGGAGDATLGSLELGDTTTGDDASDSFEFDPGSDDGEDRDEPREVVVEVDALIDVERLLLASGPTR